MMKLHVYGRYRYSRNKPMVVFLVFIVVMTITMVPVPEGILRGVSSTAVEEGGESARRSGEGSINPKDGRTSNGEKETETTTKILQAHPTGSTLPDCSHACGPCFPCKRVMVSFKCSDTESCPIVYRCMCRGKYYHVPSN